MRLPSISPFRKHSAISDRLIPSCCRLRICCSLRISRCVYSRCPEDVRPDGPEDRFPRSSAAFAPILRCDAPHLPLSRMHLSQTIPSRAPRYRRPSRRVSFKGFCALTLREVTKIALRVACLVTSRHEETRSGAVREASMPTTTIRRVPTRIAVKLNCAGSKLVAVAVAGHAILCSPTASATTPSTSPHDDAQAAKAAARSQRETAQPQPVIRYDNHAIIEIDGTNTEFRRRALAVGKPMQLHGRTGRRLVVRVPPPGLAELDAGGGALRRARGKRASDDRRRVGPRVDSPN